MTATALISPSTKIQAITSYGQWMKALRIGKLLIGRRMPMPVLATMLAAPDGDGGLQLSVTNLEQSATFRLLDADCTAPFLIPVNAVYDIMRSLPGTRKSVYDNVRSVGVHLDEDRIKVVGFGRQFSCEATAAPVADFPSVPTLARQARIAQLWPRDLQAAFGFAATAAGKDNTLPMLTGVHMTFDRNGITFAATDRYRLGVVRVRVDKQRNRQSTVLVPATVLRALKLLDQTVEIRVQEKSGHDQTVSFSSGEVELVTRSIDATFPNYTQLMPQDLSWWTVFRDQLTSDVTAAAAGLDRGERMRITFEPDAVQVDGCGSLRVLEYTGNGHFDGGVTAFNPQFLLAGLKATKQRTVRIGGVAAGKPWLVEAAVTNRGNVGRYLQMPIRLS